jgi:hypothetical protein
LGANRWLRERVKARIKAIQFCTKETHDFGWIFELKQECSKVGIFFHAKNNKIKFLQLLYCKCFFILIYIGLNEVVDRETKIWNPQGILLVEIGRCLARFSACFILAKNEIEQNNQLKTE